MNEELKLIISAEVSKLKQGVDNAKSQITNFKEQVKKASADVESKFAAIGDSMKTAATNIGIGIGAAGGALLALAGSTEEFRNQQAQLISSFEQTGASAETAKGVWNDLYRVLGDTGQAQEAAQHLAKLGVEQQALSEYTTICQGVYSQFGASLPIEGLTEGINHTVKLGEVQGTLADALEWSGISTDAFNEKLAECNTEAEREKLIRETLTGLYGDAAKVYEENNKQVLAQRDAQMALQEKTAALGEALAPVITAFTSFATDALAIVVPYITDLAEKYMPDLEIALSKASDAMDTAFSFIRDNIGTLGTIAGIVGGIAAAIGLYNTVAAVKAAMDALQVTTLAGLAAAYIAQAAAMAVAIAPYALIVAAIAAVIAIIVLCVKNWDEIKAKIKEVWDAAKKWTLDAVNNIKQKLQEIVTSAATKFTEMKTKAVEVFTGIVNSIREKFTSAKETALNIFDAIKEGIRDKFESAKQIVKDAIEALKGFFKFEWSLPKISLPKFSVSGGKAPWGFGGHGSLPKVSVKWNALGGVFDNPTIFRYGDTLQGIGEDGAEAIVPLERNTQWMDKLASMLSEKMGINQPIVLQVDGKTFAQISVDSINQLTRQRGSIPLNII